MAPSVVDVTTPEGRVKDVRQNGDDSYKTTIPASYDSERSNRVLRTFRCLIADLCEQFKGGHPGSAMGMAAMGIALWKYVMRFSPKNPNYFNRDRFILSNGHACLFQYTLMHLVGYKHMILDQLRSYHSERTDSFCPGHPEIEHEGIEVTTGPLGQGIANAVGMAMATKHLAATYNKPGFPVVSNKIWCVVGDACLQEGVALEAISLAGHWKLNDLIVIYDNNQITCDGSVDLANTEDVNAKMSACGWKVLTVDDGNEDIPAIVNALEQARAESEQPVFINIRTIIGIGSKVAGDAKAHGAALGPEDVANIKRDSNMNPEEHFVVSDETYEFFADVRERGHQYEREWVELVDAYRKGYPDIADEFTRRIKGEMVKDWKKIIPHKEAFPTTPTPSRKSAGLVCNPLASELSNIMVGTADLSPSVNMIWKGKVDFQHPDLRPACGITGDYTGRYIHWGIREHAMAAVSNGIAAYNKGTILPVTSSFFMFYLYAAPGVRMGALQRLQTIHVGTHDSIGTGEDGPTHQPIELAALYRAMPNLLYIRPADSEETAGAFIAAISATESPSIISLSRHNLVQYPQYSSRDGVQRGAYVFIEEKDADVTLIGVGSEMKFAVEAREILQEYGIRARVVSFPCQRLFEKQSREYKSEVLQYRSGTRRIVIEAYAANGWERYAHASYSMTTFGHSLPGAAAYKYFGYDSKLIALRVKGFLDDLKAEGIENLDGEFRELNLRSH
ncbi:Transketolase, thiamine diphosphate binding domain-containing protein [Xylaria flabelliformis]|nr:Transketolase, thiamine diphosphate binding domain-containing protein [Xylaria flabelliformis]